MSAKIDVQNDPALDRGDQGIEPARVEITMNDGAVFAQQVDFPTGTPVAAAGVRRHRAEVPGSAGARRAAHLGGPTPTGWWRRSPGSRSCRTLQT